MRNVRRRMAPLFILAAVLVALLPTSSASALTAPSRTMGGANPVHFVHGFSNSLLSPQTDCAMWWPAQTRFKDLGWTGPLTTVGYYEGDTRCGVVMHRADRNVSLRELGRRLAWTIYWRDSQYGRKADVVAHSMGGLILRAAITYTATNPAGTFSSGGWPPALYIEDAITIGTPHNGTQLARGCYQYTQCIEMVPGSVFLRDLAAHPNPQSDMPTDWTLIGTEDDDVVPVASATTGAPGMGHYVWYYCCAGGMEHSQQPSNVSGLYRNQYWNWNDRVWRQQTQGQSIIVTVKNAAYNWRDW